MEFYVEVFLCVYDAYTSEKNGRNFQASMKKAVNILLKNILTFANKKIQAHTHTHIFIHTQIYRVAEKKFDLKIFSMISRKTSMRPKHRGTYVCIMCECVCARVYIYIYTYIHTYMYICIYIHICIYVYIYTRRSRADEVYVCA